MIIFNFNKISIFLWVSFIAWIAIIFFLSSQTGSDTSELSGSIANIFADLIYKNPTLDQINSVNIFIRKTAHIAIFLALGIIAFLATMLTFSPQTSLGIVISVASSVAITFLIGFVDEWKKQFIEGRHFDLTEVNLNLIGGFFGVLLALLAYWIYYKRK